jgi:hypothetical protein
MDPTGAQATKKKDLWDKFDIMSKAAIAALGIVITLLLQRGQQRLQEQQHVYQTQYDREQATDQAQQRRLTEIQTVERLLSHLVSKDSVERRLAFYALQEHTNPAFVEKCVLLLSPQERLPVLTALSPSALQELQRSGQQQTFRVAVDSALDRKFAQVAVGGVVRAREASTGTKEGWAYLGDYRPAAQMWQTRYFEFADTLPVGAIAPGTRLRVRVATGALNVRRGLPTDAGEFPDVIDVLREGTQVTIRELRPWLSSSYMWARIAY